MTDAASTRPALHLTAPSGWINDPLGLTWHAGQYHIFYQHVPDSPVWDPTCHWGHAVSTDLLTWEHLPVALAPGDGDGGVWSGSLVDEPGETARIFYTAVDLDEMQIGRVREAKPVDDSWVAWTKGKVVARPHTRDLVAWRDPQIVRDGTSWRMIVGSGLRDGTAVAYSYRSDDLESWLFDGELARRHTSETDGTWTGEVWECPQLIQVGGQWVLVVAVWEPGIPHYEAYAVGSLENGRFTARSWHRMTYGSCYYAGSVFHDRDGTPGMVLWLRGVDAPDGSWASAVSIPHSWIRDGDDISITPHAAVKRRRTGARRLIPGRVVEVSGPVDIEWAASSGDRLVLVHDDQGSTIVEAHSDMITVTTSTDRWTLPLGPDSRVILDGAVLELFSAGRALAAALSAPVVGVRVAGAADAVVHILGSSASPM